MPPKRPLWTAVLLVGIVGAAAGAWKGWDLARKIVRWRHLDATYTESFASPVRLAGDLAGRKLTFHMKTGFEQDDSQICVGFNVIYAAVGSGAEVSVLFDAGALLDLTGEESHLHATRVPLRPRKVIAAQMNVALDEVPANYGAYLDLLHENGAAVYANTATLVVTGDAGKVQRQLPAFPYVRPAPYATVAGLLARADTVVAY